MLLSKDLRIGNWILKYKGGNHEPFQIDANDLVLIQKAETENIVDSHYKPIKLDKDILSLGGYKKVIEDCYTISINGYTLAVYYNEKDGIYRFNNRFYLADNAYKCYVHQLQNITYMLLGFELKLDLTLATSKSV